MKRLQQHEPYPAELWEDTDAPSWSAERVWQRIEAQQAPAPARRKWMFWLCLLALALGSVRWLSKEVSVPAELEAKPTTTVPALPVEEATEVELRKANVTQQLPETIQPAMLPKRLPFQLEAPEPSIQERPAEPQDTLTVGPIPIAQEDLPKPVPTDPMFSPLELLPEAVAELPADTREGTKLKLKIPEIPSADARQGTFAKRLWQQYKRLNTEGEIDWVELGIQPNGDGTFSILPSASKTTSKPN
ncbi:MAG: hypothetical protein AAFN81_18350 [Bacteroidota bacterium]